MCGTNSASCSARSRYGTSTARDGAPCRGFPSADPATLLASWPDSRSACYGGFAMYSILTPLSRATIWGRKPWSTLRLHMLST